MKYLIMHIHHLDALLKEHLEFGKINRRYCVTCRIFLLINKRKIMVASMALHNFIRKHAVNDCSDQDFKLWLEEILNLD
jgi:hypothetical protein